ncbi:MAG: gamma-glutamyltransferase [Burkholderiales bacterium]|nr:gamma-glutamyltransferase [Burkholderiales bacterium]
MEAPPFTTRPELAGTFGVAASTHWVASQVAFGVLERGGNAFDAAVAAGFVLQVVEPHLNGPAGEVPMLLWHEGSRNVHAIDAQGCAPADATPEAFLRRGMRLVPGIGPLAATVPAAFQGWLTLLREWGTWPLADVLAPAIGYARDGFPVSRRLAEAILGVRPVFQAHWPSSAQLWLRDGKVPAPGSLMQLPALARTYERIVEEARRHGGGSRTGEIDAALRAWTEGFVAREIDAFCRTPQPDAHGERHAAFLRAHDLAEWQPRIEAPLTARFGRFEVAKCGFWSQGPMMLQMLQMLRMLEGGAGADEPGSARFVHRVAEAAKLAFADRLAWFGCAPAAQAQAQEALLSQSYCTERASAIVAAQASRELRPGSPLGLAPRLPDLRVGEEELRRADASFGIGEPTFGALPPVRDWADSELFVGDTCHVDVIDRHGNMVSATPSGGWLSSSPAIAALGFALGTRLQMAWLDEGVPNRLTPRVAPCTTLSPSLAFRDGEPYMVFGTPGGDQQDQWQAAFFLRHAVHGMNLQEAIDAPAFHAKHYPASFWPRPLHLNRLHIEDRFAPAELGRLRDWGHEVIVGGPWSEGRLTACSRTRDRAGRLILKAAANPRGMQAYAVGR